MPTADSWKNAIANVRGRLDKLEKLVDAPPNPVPNSGETVHLTDTTFELDYKFMGLVQERADALIGEVAGLQKRLKIANTAAKSVKLLMFSADEIERGQRPDGISRVNQRELDVLPTDIEDVAGRATRAST